jgi:hypothetical protein
MSTLKKTARTGERFCPNRVERLSSLTQLEETGTAQVEYEVYSGKAKMVIHRQ